MNNQPHLILGSGSQYRRELLARLRLPFDVLIPNVDESPKNHETAEETALRLCEEKAIAIANQTTDSLIIGCDQVASLDGSQIGKPGTYANALRQLQMMRGRCVIFHTAVCLLDARESGSNWKLQSENVETAVCFRDLTDHELAAYLTIERPYDCAGSAKCEGLGIALIKNIESKDPTALIGLPLIALSTMLRRVGMTFFQS